MRFQNPMLVVRDLQKSREFYAKVLGLETILDFGSNITLTGGVALQTLESWKGFIQKGDGEISFGGNHFELYFEEDDFDSFVQKLGSIEDIQYVHPVLEHRWGRRVVRFYDPDQHIIEVGENINVVCKRFFDSGMSEEQVAVRMDVPLEFVLDAIGR